MLTGDSPATEGGASLRSSAFPVKWFYLLIGGIYVMSRKDSVFRPEPIDTADERLDRMIEIADSEGLTLDLVVHYMGRCDYKTFKAFSDNPSLLPRKI